MSGWSYKIFEFTDSCMCALIGVAFVARIAIFLYGWLLSSWRKDVVK